MKPAALILAAWCLVVPVAAGASAPDRPEPQKFQGLSLTVALQRLQREGLPIFFSSVLVRESMRVVAEPEGDSPREILAALLRPHGLRVKEGARGRLIVVAALAAKPATRERPPRREPPSRLAEVPPTPAFREDIFVTPDPSAEGTREPVEASAIQQGDSGLLPHLGDDLFRALDLLPGTAMRETSSRLHVRGGRDDEVLIRLDGMELLAPYHLQDFDSALSIVAPASLDRAELMKSGYPAEYGDRMGGVLDLTTLTPARERRLEAGIGLLYAELAASSVFGDGRGRWYATARSGSYHLALEINDREENPHFWDTFAKVDYQPRAQQSFRVNALVAQDEFNLSPSVTGEESYANHWENEYLWLTHTGVLRPDLLIESVASTGEIERRRSGNRVAGESRFEVEDFRSVGITGLRQVWQFEPTGKYSLEGGIELRRMRANADYFNDRQLLGPLAPLRSRPALGSTEFQERFDVDQSSGFLSSRARPFSALTAELGVRFDRDTLNQEGHVSPRFNLAWNPWARSTVRLAWGWFYQSQRPNELQVEDGETELARAERDEHHVLGFEHRLPGGASFQVEAFERRLSRVRPRFENLFDPVAVFPELEEDRVRIDPERGRAEGIEATYRSRRRGPLSWWLTYTASSIEETLDGQEVAREIDQPHAFRTGATYRMASGWNLSAVWLYHTGWPTTEVSGRLVREVDGSVMLEPVLERLNGERLPDYHRLDMRLSRAWDLSHGRLSGYLDLQNLYDRQNVRGFDDFDLQLAEDGNVSVRADTLSWGGFFPSFGIRWEM